MPLWSGLIAKPQRTPLKSRPSLTLYFLLAGAFLLTLVPHAIQFPPWLTVAIIVGMALRSVIELYRLPLPSTRFCNFMALLLFVLVIVQYGTFIGRAAGTAVTAGLLVIKFYELRQPRDIALIIFSCFFVVMSALLFSQVLELFVYCLIMMWVLTALLTRVQAGDRPEDMLLSMLGKSGLVFLQALPLALFLFFFFPRMNGPLGLSLTDPPIGLTDKVAPGSVSKLARDDSPAMYVSFGSGAYPLPESMYWRALVLYQYTNGVFTATAISNKEVRQDAEADKTTNKKRAEATPAPPPRDTGTSDIHQRIIIRPNNQRWLYALDVPITPPQNPAENEGWAGLYRGDIIHLNNPNAKVDHLELYYVTSSQFRQEETISQGELDASLQYPVTRDEGPINPAVVNLSNELYRKAGENQEAYISAVLSYFHHRGFIYSIDLPEQPKDWLTDFLLKSKTGYCEHFASAFAILMRLQGIPTRLVVGYVGGDFNPYSSDYTVRQSNAHAWDEVWTPTNPGNRYVGRWTRIDPTAAVSTADASAQATADNSGADAPMRIVQRPPGLVDQLMPDWAKHGMREVRLRREELEMTWDNVVLSYDTDAQFKLAQVLGFGGNPVFKLMLVCVVAAAVCALAFWRWLSRKPDISPVEFLYAAFCRNMARRGVPRASWEGPLAYTERVAEAFPDDLPALRSVGAIVSRSRYGPRPADTEAIVRLESALSIISASQAAGASREKK